MSQIFPDGLRGVNQRSKAALNREKNVCTNCRLAKVKCARDLGGPVCGRCSKRGYRCTPATTSRWITNPDHDINRGHDEPHLHNYQGSQSTFLAHAHNLTDPTPQATDHWLVNTGQFYLPETSAVYNFQSYPMSVGTHQQQQGQENAVVNAVTNNSHNTLLSINYPTWNTGLGTIHNSNELPLGYNNEFDETRLWFL